MSNPENTSLSSNVPGQRLAKKLVSMKLRDERSEKSYNLIVEEEIFIKAKRDQKYAQQLLCNYIKALGDRNTASASSASTKSLPVDAVDTQILALSNGNTKLSIRVPLELYKKSQSDLAYASQLFVAHKGQPTTANEHVLYEEDLKENSQDALYKHTESQSILNHDSAGTSSLCTTTPSRQVFGQLQARARSIVQQESLKEVNESVGTDGHKKKRSNISNSSWTHDQTLLLIESYRLNFQKYDDGKINSQQLWKKVEDLMRISYEHITAKDCEKKLNDLKTKYKDFLKENNKTGNSTINWIYFDSLHEMFHKKPWVQPLSVAGSDFTFTNFPSTSLDRKPREKKKKSSVWTPLNTLMEKKINTTSVLMNEKKKYRTGVLAALNKIANALEE